MIRSAAANTSGRFRLIHRIFGPTDCAVSALPLRATTVSSPSAAVRSAISRFERLSTL